MPVTKTIARKSVINQVLQKDGRSVLKEVGTLSRPSPGAATTPSQISVNGVIQSGRSINPGNTPGTTPAAVVATPGPQNTYFVDLASHGLSALIQAVSTEDAWSKFANKFAIDSSEREATITESVA